MNQMGVRINEARQHHAPGKINLVGALRLGEPLHFRPRANVNDHAVTKEQRSIFNDTQLRKGITSARTPPAQRQQLRRTCNQKGIAHEQYYARVPETKGPVPPALQITSVVRRSPLVPDTPPQTLPAQTVQT